MIGYVQCEFRIFDPQSLKEKRAVIKRILPRLKNKFNVSVAEVDLQDKWQATVIEIVTVSSTKKAAERELYRALNYLDSFPEWERINTTFEWL